MRAGPRINADDVALSYILFLTCRGEKYVQYYTVIQYNIYSCAQHGNRLLPGD
jgi:hypothetical protein